MGRPRNTGYCLESVKQISRYIIHLDRVAYENITGYITL